MEGARDVQQELRRWGCAFFLPEGRCRQSLTAQRANRKGGTQPDRRFSGSAFGGMEQVPCEILPRCFLGR